MKTLLKKFSIYGIAVVLALSFITSCSEEEGEKDASAKADSISKEVISPNDTAKHSESILSPSKVGAVESGSDEEAVKLINNALNLRGVLSEIKTVKIKVNMQMADVKMPMQIYATFPDKIRIEVDSGEKKIVVACDGNDCWGINPMTKKVEQLPKDEAIANKQQFRKQINFLINPLLIFREENLKYELLGKAKDNTINATKVQLVDKMGENSNIFANGKMTVYIDDKTGLDYKYQNYVTQDNKKVETNILLKNNKKIKNFIVPHILETYVNGEKQVSYETEKIEINEPISNDLFKMPK